LLIFDSSLAGRSSLPLTYGDPQLVGAVNQQSLTTISNESTIKDQEINND
jgi:hypothetical protein